MNLPAFMGRSHRTASMSLDWKDPVERRREETGLGIVVLVLVILAGVGVGVGAYNAGLSEGLTRSGNAVEVVRVGPGFGYFPFSLFLFPLLLIAFFAIGRRAFWHGPRGDHPHDGPWGHGSWKEGTPRFEERFQEWHRRQHEEPIAGEHGAGGEPAGVA